MPDGRRTLRRNLFEIENARNLTRDEIVATFVPTQVFWRLLSAKNHIILGARGSGKTALAKMLSHDHLSLLDNERARQAIRAKAFIGIYVPTSIEWVGGLKNKPWQSEAAAEEFFSWRLNISTCLAFLVTLRSCLTTYIESKGERARVENDLVRELARSWADEAKEIGTVRALQEYLEDTEHRKQQQLARARVLGDQGGGDTPVGIGFSTDLFAPLRRGITLTARALNLPSDCVWLLCLDEAEFLQPFHHRILNSYLRSSSWPLVFKITTMPYFHHTQDTNTGVPLNVGDDFEYVYVDQDPVLVSAREGEERSDFAVALFQKRAKVSGKKYRGVTLDELLGPSPLLDPKQSEWGPESPKMALLRTYASKETIARAESLSGSRSAFMDQIARKLHGALLLRHAVESQRGRQELDVYSGASMAIRCGDGNPRRLIRIFNALLLGARWKPKHTEPSLQIGTLSPKAQTRILTTFSQSTLSRLQSEPECGPELLDLMIRIGKYMRKNLHSEPLTTDQVSSIRVDKSIDVNRWKLVQRGVTLGLLFPNVSANKPDQMPEREGIFHVAYVLAPCFRTLPRRGRPRSLATILTRMGSPEVVVDADQKLLPFLAREVNK